MTKKLKKLRVIQESEHQRQRLGRWLFEWELEQNLWAEDASSAEHEAAMPTLITFPDTMPVHEPETSIPVETGQIRLLRPDTVETEAHPRYLAIISDWEEDTVLATPFSRFAEPATRGEWETARDIPCLRTLCLWNTHSVSTHSLRDSWHVDSLSPEELSNAWSVFRSCSMGMELPVELQDRIGPPVLHPEDPRIIYQDEEVEWMLKWQQAAERKQQITIAVENKKQLTVLPWSEEYLNETHMALAAGDLGYRGRKTLYAIDDTGVLLEVAVHSNEKECTLTVFDQTGELSDQLTGYSIFAAHTPDLSSTIETAQSVVGLNMLLNGFGMLDAEGNSISLKVVPG